MSDEQSELQRLRDEVSQLEQRLGEINRRLRALEHEAESARRARAVSASPPAEPARLAPPLHTVRRDARLTIAAPPMPSPVVGQPPRLPPSLHRPKESLELRLGTFWLPRIGMAVLLTGMVFFVTWSYRYMGPWGKVLLSYLCCAVLGGFGIWFEKKMPQLARILQGGALALTYFVTYAAHYVGTFRVIESASMALALLVIVVAGIVFVADRRKSPTLAGMALFFGYYTSVISGVATFTLASNALLAAAALVFLARNRWVTISYGAVFATYAAYAIWVWRVSGFWEWELRDFIYRGAYLAPEQFQLRAAFLSLYWLLFTAGGLLLRTDSLPTPERNGLFTLNNALFFVLFSLLMHHGYPDAQWQFQFCFGAALLVVSAFTRDRSTLETLFVQGLAVATLGLLSYFKGVRLVGALALESAFLLMLARSMNSRWVGWFARLPFGVAALYAWDKFGAWDEPLVYGVWFAGAVGLVCARLVKTTALVGAPFHARPVPPRTNPENRARNGAPTMDLSAGYFAFVSVALAMLAASVHFDTAGERWAWIAGSVLVAVIAAVLRTQEIFWAAQLPLIWAHATFLTVTVTDHGLWPLTPALALIAVTFAFGVGVRAWDRTWMWPYAALATLAVIVTTFDAVPRRWQLAAFSVEALVLTTAAVVAGEVIFVWLALAVMSAGALQFLGLRPRWTRLGTGWGNAIAGFGLLFVAERVLKMFGNRVAEWESRRWHFRVAFISVIAVLANVALAKLVPRQYLTVDWALCGFVVLAIGFAAKERPYRVAGLFTLALSLTRAVIYDVGRLEMPFRVLSFMGLGAILLVLAFLYTKNREKIAKWL
jgi:hypothetical protein